MSCHLKTIFAICVAFLLSACSAIPPLSPHNPMGLSGKVAPEAETNFSLAHVLWKDSAVCSDPLLAITYLDKAIRIQPDYAEAYLRRGLAKSDLHDWDGAFDDITRSIRLTPSAEAYAYRGLISMRGGNAIGARKDLDQSLSLNRKQHKAWNFRAALNLLERNTEAACDDFAQGCSNGDCIGMETAQSNGICP